MNMRMKQSSHFGFLAFTFLFMILLLTGCEWNINNLDNENENAIAISGESTVEVGKTIQLSASYKYHDGTPSVSWLSTAKEVATVDDNGLVTGVAEGEARIAAVLDGSGKAVYAFWSITVTYTPIAPTALSASITSSTIYPGDVAYITLSALPEDASTEVTYVSSDETIAIVSSNGTVTALAIGEVSITMTSKLDEAIKTSLSVTVAKRSGAPQSLAISGTDHPYVGGEEVYDVTVSPTSAIMSVTWASSDEAVATISEGGVLEALSAGIVTITATSTEDASITSSITLSIAYVRDDALESNVENVIDYASEAVLGLYKYVYYQSTTRLVKSSVGSCFVYKVWANLVDGTTEDDLSAITDPSTIRSYGYYAITNRHTVKDGDGIRVLVHTLNNETINEEIDAEVVQYDTKVDLAVITFTYGDYIHPLELADSTALKAGQFTVAIGFPEDFPETATFGIISYPSRYIGIDTDDDKVLDWYQEYIQTDAALNPGSSGGPLLNLNGQVIGITAMKYIKANDENLAFAIPASLILSLLPDLEAGVQPVRVTLGITCVTVKKILNGYYGTLHVASDVPAQVKYGLLILSVKDDSIAKKAGLEVDDYLMSFNGVKIYDNEDLSLELCKLVEGSGETITITVYRDGSFIDLTVAI